MQLTSDTALARELRRKVMVRLSQRGNEVGFSGGNVMRMDVSYFDLLGGNGRSTRHDRRPARLHAAGRQPAPGAARQPDRAGATALTPSTAGPTLRITLTLYSIDGGKVLWTASGSCSTQADKSQQAGEAMIDRIFDNADKNPVGDAGCPL